MITRGSSSANQAIGAAGPESKTAVHYFAYGANMSRSFVLKRGITPLSAESARAVGACIAFRHVGAFATLRLHTPSGSTAQPSQLEHAAHGVLLTLSSTDFSRLASFETGYTVRSVIVETYGGRRVTARAFMSGWLVLLKESLPPKETYAALLRAGAHEHSLCSEYCAWLEALPTVPSSRLCPHYFHTPADSLARGVGAAVLIAVTLAVLGIT